MTNDDFSYTDYTESFPLYYGEDALIIMHRDSHFGGSFQVMLDYYRKHGLGTLEEIPIHRIEELATFEINCGSNIASMLLTGQDAERIAQARQIYRDLRSLYEMIATKSPIPRLIADLILSEDADPTEEINNIAALGDAAIPALLDLLGSEDFYDPLFPGYGQAPSRALSCLQQIGDKRAIIALFEQIGHSDFFNEEKIFTAFRAIGEPAKEFLMRLVKSRPVTSDNEKAAMALVAFKNDANVAKACFAQLQQIADLRKDLFFATYLVLACEGFVDESDRSAFLAFAQQPGIPKALANDMRSITKIWPENSLQS